LKALGVLRLVSEQLDPEARGWWDGECFLLASVKTKDEILEFFLERYEPTPVVAPWNKGSGFYAGDRALIPAETSAAARFTRLREGIRAARGQLDAIANADHQVRRIKEEGTNRSLSKAQRELLRSSEDYKKRLAEAERAFKRRKTELIPELRLNWRGPHRAWMDTAIVLDGDGTARFPSLLGTGGNDGRLDFTNTFFQQLSRIFDLADATGKARPEAGVWMLEALFGGPAQATLSGISVGQFAPGGAGGANSGLGPDGRSRLNPGDWVLMMEGSLLFVSTANRRWNAGVSSRASAPFAVGGQSAGFASASSAEDSPRGEQWVPLWSTPSTLQEVGRLLAEGRAQLGTKEASEPADLAMAIARLGTSRGVESFQRFGYIERNGQSNLAVPLGRFVVPRLNSPKLACLDDLAIWFPRLRREARSTHAPARLTQAERRAGDALFAVTQHPSEPLRWQSLLLRLVDIEAVQVTGSGYAAGPIPQLRPEWVEAADDGSSEIRLALAFALQTGPPNGSGRRAPISGVRRHWLTLKNHRRFATSGTGGQQRLQLQVDRVLAGRNGRDDAMALVSRRLVEASQEGARLLPLQAAKCAAASSSDLARLVAGEVDLDRTVSLARALMALDARKWSVRPCPPRKAPAGDLPDDAWLTIRTALLPFAPPGGVPVGLDRAIVRRLETGDAASAVGLAVRRLRAAGLRPTVRMASANPATARLWAAALAFPIDQRAAAEFCRRLDPTSIKETAA
jgi:CRISPR-associated protein Csx17